jgi:PhzF family phenazine biosynthesis protein
MPKKSIPTFIVDAFTQKAFGGNPAAVCILNETKPDQWLQQVAAEFNLSETAFLQQQQDDRWHLRWFTPTCEVKLCGHATLASAHVLLNELKLPYSTLIFSSLSGDLYAAVKGSHIKLDFPRIFCTDIASVDARITALGLNQLCAYNAGEDIILALASEAEVANYQPNFVAIASIPTVRGVIITAKSETSERDFVSRFFAPRAGVNEDPVTGSAHCSLGSLWSIKLGKNVLRAEQLSTRRGILNLVVHDTRVDLIGECVTFLKGELL